MRRTSPHCEGPASASECPRLASTHASSRSPRWCWWRKPEAEVIPLFEELRSYTCSQPTGQGSLTGETDTNTTFEKNNFGRASRFAPKSDESDDHAPIAKQKNATQRVTWCSRTWIVPIPGRRSSTVWTNIGALWAQLTAKDLQEIDAASRLQGARYPERLAAGGQSRRTIKSSE